MQIRSQPKWFLYYVVYFHLFFSLLRWQDVQHLLRHTHIMLGIFHSRSTFDIQEASRVYWLRMCRYMFQCTCIFLFTNFVGIWDLLNIQPWGKGRNGCCYNAIFLIRHLSRCSGSNMEPTPRLRCLMLRSVLLVNTGSFCFLAFLLSPLCMISAL
jgi:hypothetical protein